MKTPAPLACVVADDNPHTLSAIEALLESEGIEVLAAVRTGGEALEALEARPMTVVVLDVRLPDLNGVEVARRVATLARSKTAVVLYTSDARSALVRDALEAGVRGIVVKGSSPVNLLAAISTVAEGGVYIDPDLRERETG